MNGTAAKFENLFASIEEAEKAVARISKARFDELDSLSLHSPEKREKVMTADDKLAIQGRLYLFAQKMSSKRDTALSNAARMMART